MGSILQTATSALSKNSPILLTAGAAAGVVTTVVLAVRATPKAHAILEEERQWTENRVPIRRSVQLTWKLYLPAAITGVGTIAAIFAANAINTKRYTALAAVYAASKAASSDYKEAVKEVLTPAKREEVEKTAAEKKLARAETSPEEAFHTGVGDTLCYDTWSGRYFRSDIETIRSSINDANRDLNNGVWISLNDLYSYIGLPPIKAGDDIGWFPEQKVEGMFAAQLNKTNDPCLVLDFEVAPRHVDG